jgi:hypothetical protein
MYFCITLECDSPILEALYQCFKWMNTQKNAELLLKQLDNFMMIERMSESLLGLKVVENGGNLLIKQEKIEILCRHAKSVVDVTVTVGDSWIFQRTGPLPGVFEDAVKSFKAALERRRNESKYFALKKWKSRT